MSVAGHTTRGCLAAALAVLAATSGGVAPVASAGARSGWTRLSTGQEDTLRQPGVHRFGRDLQVVWTEPDGQGYALWTRILNPAGHPTTGPIRILKWAELIDDPVIFSLGTQRVIVFSGAHNGNNADPYTTGAEYALTSSNGTAWTLVPGSLSASRSASGSYGTAAIDHGGTPLVAFTETSSNHITFHSGFDSTSPATAPDGKTAKTGNFAYDTGLGEDTRTAATWAVWYSNSGKAATDGVNAQQILPTLGTRVTAPNSSGIVRGSRTSAAPDEDLPVVARPASAGAGLYTAYAAPAFHSVVVWRVGSARPALVIAAPGGVEKLSMASGGHGRLWVFWRDQTSGDLAATRTNRAATRTGAVRFVAPPRNTSIYRTAGDGGAGNLEVVTLVGGAINAMTATTVLPGLTVSAAPRWRAGHRYVVHVTDAGAAVGGASVSVAGHSARTSKTGRAVIRLAKSDKPGRRAVIARRVGYASARIVVAVRR